MDEATARARIETMTQASVEPGLTFDEVEQLVLMAARLDSSGLAPADAGWTGTYDLSAAAAEGWRWKAGKVAAEFDFVTDSQRFDKSQKHAACMAMAEHYARRILNSPRIRSGQPIIAPPTVLTPTEEALLP